MYSPRLEVFEYSYNEDEIFNNKYTLSEEIIHKYVNNNWVKSQNKIYHHSILKIDKIYEYLDDGLDRMLDDSGYLFYFYRFFSTLELAKIAKIILVKNNSDYYKYDIHNIEKPLKEVKEKYPEYFI